MIHFSITCIINLIDGVAMAERGDHYKNKCDMYKCQLLITYSVSSKRNNYFLLTTFLRSFFSEDGVNIGVNLKTKQWSLSVCQL